MGIHFSFHVGGKRKKSIIGANNANNNSVSPKPVSLFFFARTTNFLAASHFVLQNFDHVGKKLNLCPKSRFFCRKVRSEIKDAF